VAVAVVAAADEDLGGRVAEDRDHPAGELDPLTVRSSVERAGGHATLFRGGDRAIGVFHPLQPAILKIHRRLKNAFDPAGVLNSDRMYRF